MNIVEAIRKRIIKFLRIEHLEENPNSERYNFIFEDDNIKNQKLQENRIWYYGDSDELLNYYTSAEIHGNNKEPIYTRNKRNYFWGLSANEADIKRVHSGIPKAIVTTLVNAIGNPSAKIKDVEINSKLEKILDENNMVDIINQQQMPLTLVEGWGAFKINIDKELSNYPIIEYYEAQDVEFVYKSKRLIGIIYKDYYQYKNKKYVLFETRRKLNGDSLIEYELFRLEKNNEITPVKLGEVPELESLEDKIIPGLNKILGVPSKFFFDMMNKNYGLSIFNGKIDLFDDLDQILSQDSQTVRVSTPVEYYPVDLLERTANGKVIMPSVYNRQYVQKESLPNGDGTLKGDIQTTQPTLEFEKYSVNAKSKLDFILTGLLSPATMGIDIAKKDNAEAQREKEKVTIMTRNNIIEQQTKILSELYNLCLIINEYLETGKITTFDYQISVTFNEFANPSFENELQVLGTAWSNGQISTEKYVNLLWGDKISEEDRAIEIAWLDAKRKEDNLTFGDFEDESPIGVTVPEERTTTEAIKQPQE